MLSVKIMAVQMWRILIDSAILLVTVYFNRLNFNRRYIYQQSTRQE